MSAARRQPELQECQFICSIKLAPLGRCIYSTQIAWLRLEWREPRTEKCMAWTTPVLVEICIGLEINGYLPAEF